MGRHSGKRVGTGLFTRPDGSQITRISEIASPNGAGISCWRWRVILLCGRTEQFGEDGLQRIRPYLVALGRWMKFIVRVHHAFEELAVRVRQLVIDIHVTGSFAIGEL